MLQRGSRHTATMAPCTYCLLLLLLPTLSTCFNVTEGGSTQGPTHFVTVSVASPNQTIVMLGDTLQFDVSITIPPLSDTDAKVLLSGADIETGNTKFTVWEDGVVLDSLTRDLQQEPKYFASDTQPEVYDKVHLDLGTLTTSENVTGTLTLTLKAAMVHYSGIAIDDTVTVYLGINYDNDSLIYSYISSFTVDNTPKSAPNYNVSVSCDPITLEVDYYTLCQAVLMTSQAFVADLHVNVEVENHDTLKPYSYCTSNIREVKRTGSHVPVPPEYQRHTSYTSPHYSTCKETATLFLGQVVKLAGMGSVVVEFAMATYHDNTRAGQDLQVNVTVVADELSVGENTHILPISELVTTHSELEAGMVSVELVVVNNTELMEVSSGGIVNYLVHVNLTGYHGKYHLYLTTAATHPGLTVCRTSVLAQGFNVPHVRNPEMVNGEHINGYIINTQQVPEPGDSWVTYLVTASFVADPGTTASIKFYLKDGTDVSATASAQIKVPSSEMEEPPIVSHQQVHKSWTLLEGNRAAAFTVAFSLAPDTIYPEIQLIIEPDPNAPPVPFRMCNVFFSHVGKNMPCLDAVENNIIAASEVTRTWNTSYFDDGVQIDLGILSSISGESEEGEVRIMTIIALPWGMPGLDALPDTTIQPEMNYTVGMKVGETMFWGNAAYFKLSAAVLSTQKQLGTSPLHPPQLYLSSYPNNALVTSNLPFIVVATIRVGPGMTHDFDLVVLPPSGVQLCRLSLMERGLYLGCVRGGDWRRGERFAWDNTTRLCYQHDPSGSVNATVTFLGLTNVGTQPINVTYNDYNDLMINIPVIALPDFTAGDLMVSIRSIGGDESTELANSTLTLDASAPPTDLPIPTNNTITFTDTPTEFVPQVVGTLEVEVEVWEGTSHLLAVIVTAPAADVTLCSAQVTFVGEMMPCVNGSLANTTYTSEGITVEIGRCVTSSYKRWTSRTLTGHLLQVCHKYIILSLLLRMTSHVYKKK
ncbi:uncharacterized protein LOC121855493 [Homarus americanus]|uniref:uncharacterized protein LOC121855493 n=1 Tax=Homarus americanus TaxID=6706 RepID=UPI001C4734D2|nr:uncharacterized protein LOC121855493 [Homarus americanus]